jgi:exosortase E/protease (VPEID-CTERM system)
MGKEINRALYVRGLVCVSILLVEYLLIAVAFDAAEVSRGSERWAWFGSVGRTAALALSVFSAGLIRRGPSLREDVHRLSGQLGSVRWGAAGLHVLIFAGLIGCSAQVFAPGGLSSSLASLLVVGWVLLAIATPVSLLVAIFGDAWRELGIALARLAWSGLALGGIAYFAAFHSQRYWPWLARGTLALSGMLLGLVSNDIRVLPDELVLGLGSVDVEIAEPCSGAEGIGLVFVLLAGYLYTSRTRLHFPRALLLLPLGVATIWLLNAVRVAALVAVGAWISPSIAFGGFHSKAGWVAVCAVVLAGVWLTERTSLFARDRTPLANPYNPTAVYCLPLLVLVGIGMLTGLASSDVDWLYWVRLLGAAAVLYAYRREYKGLVTRPSLLAVVAGIVVFVLWLALAGADTGAEAKVTMAHPGPAPHAAWLVSRIVGTVLFVPIVEELAFRGFLQRRLISSDFEQVPLDRFSWLSLVVSAVAFGVVHEHLVAGTLAGIVYSVIGYRRGRLADCMVAHATTNALLAATALAFGRWDLLA